MSVDTAFRQLRDANPVTNPAALREHRQDAAAFLKSTQQRSGRMQTQDKPLTVEPPPRSPRRRWLIPALAGAALAIAAIVVVTVLTGGQTQPAPFIAPGTTLAPAPENTPQTTLATTPEPAAIPTLAGGSVLTISLRFGETLPFFDATADPATGFDIELMNEMASRAVLTVNPVIRAGIIQDHLESVSSGQREDVHVGSITITEDRQQLVRFTDPYYLNQLVLVVNADLTPEIGSIADLTAGDRVTGGGALGFDWIEENLVPAGIEPVFAFGSTPFDSLTNGEAEALVFDEAAAREAIKTNPGLQVVEVMKVDEAFGFAVDPNNPELLSALNEALQSMIDDGTYQTIYDRWFDFPDGSVAR
jgi:glutamine transport system substrate-binding protein